MLLEMGTVVSLGSRYGLRTWRTFWDAGNVFVPEVFAIHTDVHSLQNFIGLCTYDLYISVHF